MAFPTAATGPRSVTRPGAPVLLLATSLSMAHAAPTAKPRHPVVRFLVSVFGPPDEDGDGISDFKDRCRVSPETVNGYADDDGCPDHLAVLDVGVWAQGQLVPSELTVARAGGTDTVTGPRAAEGLVPGEVVYVTATHGCSVSTGVIEIGRGHNRLDLELAPSSLMAMVDGQCVPTSAGDAIVADAD